MNEKTTSYLTRRATALLLALLLIFSCAAVSAAEEIATPSDLTPPETTDVPAATEAPAPAEEPEPAVTEAPVVYRLSVFIQNSDNVADFTWVGKLPLSSSSGMPAVSVEQLTALLTEKGYSLNLEKYSFQYGTGSEMRLQNWLGSESRGTNPVLVLRRAPEGEELFLLLTPIAERGSEEEIVLEEGSVNNIGSVTDESQAEKQTEVQNRREVVEVVELPYTVSIEVVDPQEEYCYGDAVTIRAVVTGKIGEPRYQWEVLGIGEDDWQIIDGAAEETYTFILDESNSNGLLGIRVVVFDAAAERGEE